MLQEVIILNIYKGYINRVIQAGKVTQKVQGVVRLRRKT